MNIEQLKELTKVYPYKVELHAHTSPVSPCSEVSPKQLVECYKNKGYDAVVITNHLIAELLTSEDLEQHLSYYLKDYQEAKSEGEKLGLNVLLGLEIRFPENENDYLVYGIDERDVAKAITYLKSDYKTFYKNFKNDKNLIIQAHPFRDGIKLQDADYVDGVETFNCHPHHNSRIALATRYAKEHPYFIETAGTDFHHLGHEGAGAMLFKALPKDSFELVELLKSRDYLFNVSGSIVLP